MIKIRGLTPLHNIQLRTLTNFHFEHQYGDAINHTTLRNTNRKLFHIHFSDILFNAFPVNAVTSIKHFDITELIMDDDLPIQSPGISHQY